MLLGEQGCPWKNPTKVTDSTLVEAGGVPQALACNLSVCNRISIRISTTN